MIVGLATVAARPQRLNLLVAERLLAERRPALVDSEPQLAQIAVDERRALRVGEQCRLSSADLVLEPGLRSHRSRRHSRAQLRGDRVVRLGEGLLRAIVDVEVRNRAEDVGLWQLAGQPHHPAGLHHHPRGELALIAEVEAVRPAGLDLRVGVRRHDERAWHDRRGDRRMPRRRDRTIDADAVGRARFGPTREASTARCAVHVAARRQHREVLPVAHAEREDVLDAVGAIEHEPIAAAQHRLVLPEDRAEPAVLAWRIPGSGETRSEIRPVGLVVLAVADVAHRLKRQRRVVGLARQRRRARTLQIDLAVVEDLPGPVVDQIGVAIQLLFRRQLELIAQPEVERQRRRGTPRIIQVELEGVGHGFQVLRRAERQRLQIGVAHRQHADAVDHSQRRREEVGEAAHVRGQQTVGGQRRAALRWQGARRNAQVGPAVDRCHWRRQRAAQLVGAIEVPGTRAARCRRRGWCACRGSRSSC